MIALVLCGCGASLTPDKSDTIVSMQMIDRNHFTETMSNADRLASFQKVDFLSPQPYEKVLRVYGRNRKGQSLSKITSYHDNGGLYQYLEAVDGRAHGLYREWFSNGELHVEAHLIEGVADIHELAQATWVFDGECKAFDEEGDLAALFHYTKGMLVGQATYFFKEGAVERVIPYEQGLVHGISQLFDLQGHLLEEVPHVQGKREGLATAHWEKGKRRSLEHFQGDRWVEAIYWDPQGVVVAEVKEGRGKVAQFEQGKLIRLLSIHEGIVEGEICEFKESGELEHSYHVYEGKKHGEECEYYPGAPQAKLSIHWEKDQIQGLVKTWYLSGVLESQREVHHNKKQGSSFAWYQNGDLMFTEEYENDLLVKGVYYKKGDKRAVSRIDSGKGIATLHTPEGLFLKKVNYARGKPLLHTDSIH